MKNLKIFVFVALSMTASVGAMAQSGAKEVGNGGDGYRGPDGRLYVLDLVESGVHRSPYLSENVEIEMIIRERVARALANLEGAPVDLIARKITEISQTSHIFALNLLYAIEMYMWKLVPKLVEVDDEDSVLEIGDGFLDNRDSLVQLAIRREKSIHIYEDPWLNELDDANRAALVLHEIVFAMTPPVRVEWLDKAFYVQSSYSARAVVGFLFSKELSSRPEERMDSIAWYLTAGGAAGRFREKEISYPSESYPSEPRKRRFLVDETGIKVIKYRAKATDEVRPVEINPTMDYSQLEAIMLDHCNIVSGSYGMNDGRVYMLPLFTTSLTSAPRFSTYKSRDGRDKTWLTPSERRIDYPIYHYESQDEKVGSYPYGKRYYTDICVKSSMNMLRQVWNKSFETPFPKKPVEVEKPKPQKKR